MPVRCLPFVWEAFDRARGVGGSEGVVDKPRRRQKLARIRHADECISPDARCAFEMRVAGLCRPRHPAMVSPAFEPASHPRVRGTTPGFKPEHHPPAPPLTAPAVPPLLPPP